MARDVRGRASSATIRIRRTLGILAMLLALSAPVLADGGVTFTDIAGNGGAGIAYGRVPSARVAAREAIEALGVMPLATWRNIRAFQFPMKANGAPGVAILDFDNDGDLDIYVTNGPGAANSLYSSQLKQTGHLTFVDVAAAAGVTATSQDSSGVCYGDIDNDGDDDLYVLGSGEQNRLFENRLVPAGSAVFTDITVAAGAGGSNRFAAGCSMGDVNGDGLLDIVIANTYDDWNHQRPTFVNETYVGFQHNTLLINQGGNEFSDETAARGLETIIGLPAATLTWAIAMVDYDLDGDLDIFFADSQGPPATRKEDERGYNRLYENDGTGHFTDVTFDKKLDKHGSWMGLAFADFNCDGHIDFHSTNLGSYMGGPGAVTRHFLGGPNGLFTDPGIGALVTSSFGWGNVTTDYDNDGDFDILYNGAMDILTLVTGENPGHVLQNQGCTAQFQDDFGARLREHRNRVVEGVALGDLNADGFEDVVTVASFHWDVPNPHFQNWVGVLGPPNNSPLDPFAKFQGLWLGTPTGVVFLDVPRHPGDLSIEINSGGNGNGSVAFSLVGAHGLLSNGEAPRSAFGAVLSFTPKNGQTTLKPLVGGASYASQDSPEIGFGLGKANKGTLDVLWPGGTRNRLYDVHKGERLNLPEIPCSFDADWASYQAYHSCVTTALDGLRNAGVVSTALHGRLLSSAIKAYRDEQ